MYNAEQLIVWIINPFDDVPNEGKAQRFWTLAAALMERGHSVVWWSSDFSHRRKLRREEANTGTGERIDVRLVRTPTYRKNVSLWRIWSHNSYGRRILKEACAGVESGKLRRPDVIVASLPPMEGPIAALRLRERFGCRVITDIMDAWPETLLQAFPRNWLGRMIGRILLRPYGWMLRRSCAESDAVSAQSFAFANFARAHGAGEDVHVCYLGADPRSPSTTAIPRAAGPFRLVYLGAMGRSYDLITLIDAVKIVRASDIAVDLVLVGDGEQRENLQALANDAVRFTGYLTGESLEQELSTADVGVIPLQRTSGVTVPYKAGEYLAHGLPLLSSLNGELGELIRRHKCGLVYEPSNSQSLAIAIREYASDLERVARESANAFDCFNERFDRTKTYSVFADWIEQVASGSESSTKIRKGR